VLVRPDEKVPIARLLTFLEQGERMANECAKAQAVFAPESGSRRFLLSQARQEAAHALVRQDLLETFLAEQVILEGLGEAILMRIEEGLAKRAAPFWRLWHLQSDK
jgi:hypothetical protein